MQLKFTFFSPVISRSIFIENPMVDPYIKWRKSKGRAKKPSKKRPYQYLSKRVHISGFVTHRTSTLPFLLKVPALLAIKLVCHWFLWLAKHIPYWYLISRVLNFATLARQYFAGFYFRDFNRQIWKKGIKFRDWSVLNFILFFQRSELFKVSR